MDNWKWTPQMGGKVVRFLHNRPTASMRALAAITGVSHETVRAHLAGAFIFPSRIKSNLKEYAAKWNCSEHTLYEWAQSGKIKAVRHGGYGWVIIPQENPRVCRAVSCGAPLPKLRRYYCSPEHAREAKRRSIYRSVWRSFKKKQELKHTS